MYVTACKREFGRQKAYHMYVAGISDVCPTLTEEDFSDDFDYGDDANDVNTVSIDL